MAGGLRVRHLPSDALLVQSLEVAKTPEEKVQGLLGRTDFPKGSGLLLPGTWAIHMHGMQFPIDVVFLTSGFRVAKLVHEIQPGEEASEPTAAYALELPAGTLIRHRLQLDDQMAIEPFGDRS